MDKTKIVVACMLTAHGAHEVHVVLPPTSFKLPILEGYHMPTLPHIGESTAPSTAIAAPWAIASVTSAPMLSSSFTSFPST